MLRSPLRPAFTSSSPGVPAWTRAEPPTRPATATDVSTRYRVFMTCLYFPGWRVVVKARFQVYFLPDDSWLPPFSLPWTTPPGLRSPPSSVTPHWSSPIHIVCWGLSAKL